MRSLRLPALLSVVTASVALVAMACDEDQAIVRPRLIDLDATVTDGSVTSEGGTLGCGATIPTTYESAGFATNAAVELALGNRVQQIADKMSAAEGTNTTIVTTIELKDLYGQGTPSLRAVSTPVAQGSLDGYFDAFGAAAGKTWAPADADQDGGALTGGKYADTFYFSSVGLDLREAVNKTLLGGALYNHALGIVAQQITSEASVDRLVAVFGASAALANRTDLDGSVDEDRFIAGYASRRDATASNGSGPYRRIKTALLTMKAAVRVGDKCKADLDLAVGQYLLEWERTTFASAIFYLNAAAVAAADPQKGPLALRAYGQGLGFIQSFSGLERRKISDSQIDALTKKLGADTPYKLVTSPGSRVLSIQEAIADIALYEGFTASEVEGFRK